MSSKTRRFFISDIHLGGDKAWHKASKHKESLLTFLGWLNTQSDIKDLVLLGDIFDTWMFPMEDRPETMAQIGYRHDDILRAIAACSVRNGGCIDNIFYLNGNHDMRVTQADLDTLFPPGVVRWIARYNAGLVYAEHGNRFAMFNAPDKLHDPADGLPLGYFITRMIASSNLSYKSPDAVFGYLENMLEAWTTTQTISQSVMEALMERCGKAPDSVFMMPEGRRDLTVADVQKKYTSLFQRWVEKFGHMYALQSLRGDAGSINWFADRLCEKFGYRVLVFGHTHAAVLDEDKFLVKKRIYANAGYWCDDKKQSFVEVDKQGGGNLAVKLWKVVGGKLELDCEKRVEAY